jgi:hypothetical protein
MSKSDWDRPKSDAAPVSGLSQADYAMMKELKESTARVVGWIFEENERLKRHLALIDDALQFYAVDSWMSVRSVVNILTDKNEVDKLIETVRPESKFHQNPKGVLDLVVGLSYWRARGFFKDADQVVTAFNILSQEAVWNARFLQAHRR